MASPTATTRTGRTEQGSPPTWIKPELAALVKAAPNGPDWLHEIKFDGYRMHARLHRSATQSGALDTGLGFADEGACSASRVNILTRRGNDWTAKYPAIAEALLRLPAKNAYLDGELCGVLPDGRTAFNLIQNASDTGRGGSLVFFLFDLLFIDDEDITALPLIDRRTRLAKLLNGAPSSLQYSDHQIGRGPDFHRLACERGLEGIVSKRVNGRYEPDRRSWVKTKCLNREEFVMVGWSDPEGSRHRIGSLLPGYFTPAGDLIYAGRVGTGMPVAELERVWRRLQPLAVEKMPLSEPSPRGSRFGSPLVLSWVHWVRPVLVVEVSYVEWTPDKLLRHVGYLGEHKDKPAVDVHRDRA